MNPYVVLVLEALLYALLFGALSWLRGEGLPARFAWEVVGVTALCLAVCRLAGTAMHPVLYLVIVYLVTMRTRLLVDLGNAFSARGRYERALAIFRLAEQVGGDRLSRTMAHINTAVVQIRAGRNEEAVAVLNAALALLPRGRGGPKYEAACRYNLGLAYLRLGQEASAVQHFNQVIELLPNSLYARGAESALRKRSAPRP